MNESELPVPTNNFEDYLSNLCGVPGELPVPRSRADIYLKYLCEHQTQGKTFVMGWKKGTTPDVTKIPAGITVTYEGQSYTGTLAASDQTTAGLYLVYNGNSTEGGIDYYDEYGTVQNADETYSWERIGGTSIDTSVVFMNEDGSSYTTMGDLRTRINTINAGHGHVFFDMSSVITGAYVCLITLTEDTAEGSTTYTCEINDLLNGKVYRKAYNLADTITAFISSASEFFKFHCVKMPANITYGQLYDFVENINAVGKHVLFDLSEVIPNAYICLVRNVSKGSYYVRMIINDLLTGARSNGTQDLGPTWEIRSYDHQYTFGGVQVDHGAVAKVTELASQRPNGGTKYLYSDNADSGGNNYMGLASAFEDPSKHHVNFLDLWKLKISKYAGSITSSVSLRTAFEQGHPRDIAREPDIVNSISGTLEDCRIYNLGSKSSLSFTLPSSGVTLNSEIIIQFTASADFTPTITGTVEGDTGFTAVSGKTYQLAFTGKTATSWWMTYRGA